MPVIQQLTSHLPTNPLLVLAVVPAAAVLFHVIAYLKDSLELCSYPGPFLAKFMDAWMFWVVNGNRWSTTVKGLHKKYGMSLCLLILEAAANTMLR